MRNNTYTLRSHLEVLEYCVADRNSVIILYRKCAMTYHKTGSLIHIELFIGKTNGIWLHIAILGTMFERLEWIE